MRALRVMVPKAKTKHTLDALCLLIFTFTKASHAGKDISLNSSRASGGVCTWPVCAPYCEACNTLLQGDCTYEKGLISEPCGSLAEDDSSTNTGVLGYCVIVGAPVTNSSTAECRCPPGYCKVDKADFCQPATCFLGAKPASYTPDWAVQSLSAAAFTAEAPSLYSSENFGQQWMAYAEASLYLPIMFLVFGLCAACCSCSAIATPCKSACMNTRATCCASGLLASIIVFLAAVGLGVGMTASAKYFNEVDQGMSSLGTSVNRGFALIDLTAQTMMTLENFYFNEIPKKCPFPMGAVIDVGFADQKEQLGLINDVLSELQKIVQPHSSIMQDVNEIVNMDLQLTYKLPLIPLVVLLLLALVVFCNILCTGCENYDETPTCAKNIDASCRTVLLTSMAWCNVFFVLSGAILLASTILTAGFCVNADSQVLGFSGAQRIPNASLMTSAGFHMDSKVNFSSPMPRSEDIRILRYYFSGYDNPNPLRTHLTTLDYNLRALIDDIEKFEVLFEVAEWILFCPIFNTTSIKLLLEEPLADLQEVNGLIAAETLWPVYDDLVRQGYCSAGINSLGVVSFITCIVSACLWPVLSCMTSVHLTKWSGKDGERVSYTELEDPNEQSVDE